MTGERAVRHLFLINPAAGKRGDIPALEAEIDRALAGQDVQKVLTRSATHARELAQAAAETGEQVRIYACGGDGTLNGVVNGAAGFSNVAVTNVPRGTGNDFLRIFSPGGKGAFSDLAALAAGPQAAFDLMDCNGLLGVNVVCAGVDARVAADVHRFTRLPLVRGTGAYVLSLIANVLGGITRPMRVEMGPICYDGPTAILCICNGRYYGGGFCPVPEAMPDDGELDMLLVGDIGRLELARHVGQYATGRYRECPELIRAWRGDRVTFSSQEAITVVVDGEILRDTAFTLSLSPKKVNFFWPAGVSYGAKFSTQVPSL